MDIINKTSISAQSVTHTHKRHLNLRHSLYTPTSTIASFKPQLNENWFNKVSSERLLKDQISCLQKNRLKQFTMTTIYDCQYSTQQTMINWIRSPTIWLSDSCTGKQLIDWSPCLWEINPFNFFKDKGFNAFHSPSSSCKRMPFHTTYLQSKEKLFPS